MSWYSFTLLFTIKHIKFIFGWYDFYRSVFQSLENGTIGWICFYGTWNELIWVDLGFYRDLGSCSGIIGNPTRELILEILYVNTNEYKEIPGSILQRNKSATECQNYEQIKFGLLFSLEMKDSRIRCRPSGNVNNETIAEESLVLIPRKLF